MEDENHDNTFGKCDCSASCNCSTTTSILTENITVKLEPKPDACNVEIATTGALNLLAEYGNDNSSSNSDDDDDDDGDILDGNLDCKAGAFGESAAVAKSSSDEKLAKYLITSQINQHDYSPISDSEDDLHSLGSNDDECNYQDNDGASDDLPLIDDLKINVDEADCDLFGKIKTIVGNLVVVEPFNSKKNILNLDTVLFLEKGKTTLGIVFDVIGNIGSPEYCIRFNSIEDIKRRDIKINVNVYIAPKTEYTKFVIISELMKDRGCDASWEHDIEAPDKFKEFSDDESEYNAKAERKYENLCKRQMKKSLNDPQSINNSNANIALPPTSNNSMHGLRHRQPSIVYSQNNQSINQRGFRHYPTRTRFPYRPHAYRQPHYYPFIPNQIDNYNNQQMFNPLRPSIMFPPPPPPPERSTNQLPPSQFQSFNITHDEYNQYNIFAAPTSDNNELNTQE